MGGLGFKTAVKSNPTQVIVTSLSPTVHSQFLKDPPAKPGLFSLSM